MLTKLVMGLPYFLDGNHNRYYSKRSLSPLYGKYGLMKNIVTEVTEDCTTLNPDLLTALQLKILEDHPHEPNYLRYLRTRDVDSTMLKKINTLEKLEIHINTMKHISQLRARVAVSDSYYV